MPRLQKPFQLAGSSLSDYCCGAEETYRALWLIHSFMRDEAEACSSHYSPHGLAGRLKAPATIPWLPKIQAWAYGLPLRHCCSKYVPEIVNWNSLSGSACSLFYFPLHMPIIAHWRVLVPVWLPFEDECEGGLWCPFCCLPSVLLGKRDSELKTLLVCSYPSF